MKEDSQNSDRQWLEEKLREEEPYLENGAFSEGVLQRLPSRRRLPWRVKRRLVKAAAIAVGLGACGALLAADGVLQAAFESSLWITLVMTGFFVALGAACTWVVSDRV